MEQHAERLGFDNERLEGARVAAARASPLVRRAGDRGGRRGVPWDFRVVHFRCGICTPSVPRPQLVRSRGQVWHTVEVGGGQEVKGIVHSVWDSVQSTVPLVFGEHAWRRHVPRCWRMHGRHGTNAGVAVELPWGWQMAEASEAHAVYVVIQGTLYRYSSVPAEAHRCPCVVSSVGPRWLPLGTTQIPTAPCGSPHLCTQGDRLADRSELSAPHAPCVLCC